MPKDRGSLTSATKAVVDFIIQSDLESFPKEAVGQAKRCLIDGLGVILAGSTDESSIILRNQVRSQGGRKEATVLGTETFRAPAALAARANGTSGHAMDYDDTQLSNSPNRIFGLLTHPTIPPLSASLAVGEKLSVTGARFVEAFLTGFEVECKIAEAIRPDHYQRGFHSSGTCGVFGAMACAAKLMRLDGKKIEIAVGIAASLAAGIRVSFGTMTKPLHVGRAAENGVMAAELASMGYTAGENALDGPWGFFQVLGGGLDEDSLVGALGNPHSILDPGVSVKPYPSGSLGHPSMDALLQIVEEHDIRPETIETIVFRAGKNILNPLRYRKATTALEAKFCIPFILSSIVLRRRAGIHEFTDAFVSSPEVERMMERVEIVHDLEIEAKGFDKMRSAVEVRLRNGKSHVQQAEVYRGGPERPLTRGELHGKFTECAGIVLEDDAVRAGLDLIKSIDEQESIAPLITTLAPRGGTG